MYTKFVFTQSLIAHYKILEISIEYFFVLCRIHHTIPYRIASHRFSMHVCSQMMIIALSFVLICFNGNKVINEIRKPFWFGQHFAINTHNYASTSLIWHFDIMFLLRGWCTFILLSLWWLWCYCCWCRCECYWLVCICLCVYVFMWLHNGTTMPTHFERLIPVTNEVSANAYLYTYTYTINIRVAFCTHSFWSI